MATGVVVAGAVGASASLGAGDLPMLGGAAGLAAATGAALGAEAGLSQEEKKSSSSPRRRRWGIEVGEVSTLHIYPIWITFLGGAVRLPLCFVR